MILKFPTVRRGEEEKQEDYENSELIITSNKEQFSQTEDQEENK